MEKKNPNSKFQFNTFMVDWNVEIHSKLLSFLCSVVVRRRIPQVALRPTHRRNHVVQVGADLLTIINNSNELYVRPMVRRFSNAPRSPPYVLGRKRSRSLLMYLPRADDSTDMYMQKKTVKRKLKKSNNLLVDGTNTMVL